MGKNIKEIINAIGILPQKAHSCVLEMVEHSAHAIRFLTGRFYLTDVPKMLKPRGNHKHFEETNADEGTNEYAALYFPAVYEALRRRNLDFVVELPETATTLNHNVDKDSPLEIQWLDYDVVYAQRGNVL